MSDTIDFYELVNGTRARVYLLWGVITGAGFTATHFIQNPMINFFWIVLAAIGLMYMRRVMPIKIRQFKMIYLSWLIPITFGLVVSVLLFQLPAFYPLIGYLGPFWLILMAAGFLANGYVDPPAKWYYLCAFVNISAAIMLLIFDQLLSAQYLVAAVISFWSMVSLWLFRSGA